jgi:murein DD-endopeptidase MepM/ murein hydrolase activator NlpD
LIFRRKKYHFNHITLSYEEIIPDRKKRLRDTIIYIAASVVFTLVSGFLLNHVFVSPKSLVLESKVLSLNTEMQSLLDRGQQFSTLLHNVYFPKDKNFRTILQIDTLPLMIQEAGTGGSAAYNALALNDDISTDLNNLITKLNLQLQIQTGSNDLLYTKARQYAAEMSHMPAIQPISQKDLIMISSNFGLRSDPFHAQLEVHSGLDFVASIGKDVYATGDGIVTLTGFSRTGYGNEVVLDHGFGFGSRYAHLSKILVTVGQKVRRGQLIGKVGASGRSTGPHLHYEVLYENRPVNPAFYFDSSLTYQEYRQILQMASNRTN